ncbi:MAG: phosphatase PAP2 family protein [Eubacteriales bacterium]|nr:phosphatase PAP2 family protein [Eubacteriales bacterium]MDY3333240.1 phosphatase PAP2 family protein [Gallibacter sp.]
MSNDYHYDLTIAFDMAVPLQPWWVIIYVLSFPFWAVMYIIIAREGEEQCAKLVITDIVAKIICGVFFVLMPTTIARPELGNSLGDYLLSIIYGVDMPYNLFPSIHCLVSWLCFIGIRKEKNASFKLKLFTCIFAIAICLSTQLTKQHYIVDLVSGIAMAEGLYWLVEHVKFKDKPVYQGVVNFLRKEKYE